MSESICKTLYSFIGVSLGSLVVVCESPPFGMETGLDANVVYVSAPASWDNDFFNLRHRNPRKI